MNTTLHSAVCLSATLQPKSPPEAGTAGIYFNPSFKPDFKTEFLANHFTYTFYNGPDQFIGSKKILKIQVLQFTEQGLSIVSAAKSKFVIVHEQIT